VTDDVLSRLVIEGYLLQLGNWAGRRNYWAWTVLTTLVDERPDLAWPMLLELLRRIPDEHLDELAAGPLEDFIAQHEARVIDVVESEAARNPRLRLALAGVWQNATPPAVWARIEALADRTGSLIPNVPDWTQNVIEAAIESLPPPRAGSRNEAAIAARSLLLGSMTAARRDDGAIWDSPVDLELHLEPGVDGFPEHATTIIEAVVETIAADRPPGLVAPEWDNVALITSTSLVRELEVIERRGRTPGYRVKLQKMSDAQVEALNDVSTLEELLEGADVKALEAELLEMLDSRDQSELPPGPPLPD
jgi:Family of unknown function (DUF6869)